MIFIAIVGILILLGLAIFQLSLVFGAPLGEYAWGGQQKVLPRKLRIASGFSIILYGVFAVFLASKAGLINGISNESLLTVGMWVLTGYFVLGIFMNAISRSKKERAVMTPVALVLAVIFLVMAFA